MIAMQWPKASTVAAAIRGDVAQVLALPGDGGNCKGVASAYPWIMFLLQPPAGPMRTDTVVCFRCEDAEVIPDPPQGQGTSGEKAYQLLAPGTLTHALFVLSWLNKFARSHSECVEPPPAEERTDPQEVAA